MKLTREEQETIILFNETDLIAEIYTCNGRLIRRLDKLCSKYDGYTIVQCGNGWGKYIVPKRRIQVSAPRSDAGFLTAKAIQEA